MPNINDHYFTGERCFAVRVSDLTDDRWRLCDCHICVSHALSLTHLAYSCELPTTPGVTFMHVPGLQLRPFTEADRQFFTVIQI